MTPLQVATATTRCSAVTATTWSTALTGGPGRDVFVFHLGDGQDTATDFDAAEDGIALSEIDSAEIVVRVDGSDSLLECPGVTAGGFRASPI